MSNDTLHTKALELAQSFSTIPPMFKASPMWLKRWKKRNGISLRCTTNDSQKVPEEYGDILCNFRASIVKYHLEHVVGKHSIRIVSTKAKKGFTIALAAKDNGDKLPALVIFKERGGKLGPRVRQSLAIPDNVHVTASTNGWMTAQLYNW